jgi:membrane protein required for colicin V production
MKNFPIADGAVLLVVAAFFLRSYFRGALREVFSLVAMMMGYLAAGRYGSDLGEVFGNWISGGRWVQVAANSIVFIAVWLGAGFLGKLLSRLADRSQMGPANRIAGGIVGLAKGMFVLGAVFAILEAFAPSVLPAAHENERVMPYVRLAGKYFQRAAKLDLEEQMELIKKSVGLGAGKEEEKLPPAEGK